jgi:Fe-S cluster assembly ATP-binding protein
MVLKIEDLHASVEDTPILKGLNLIVNPGEIHAIMGPNGAGKSTLAKVLSGHPSYEITSGSISFKDKDLLELEPDERAHAGLFMSFQYPIEIPGVSNKQFLHSAYNAVKKGNGEVEVSEEVFDAILSDKMKQIHVSPEFKDRNLNEGFSGGEKKRNEILQMLVLDPSVGILDETDSGLDIDAMRIVAEGINTFMKPSKGLILITHYQRLLDYIKPDYVHVMLDGKIVQSGDATLALELEEKGYECLSPSSSHGGK